MKLFVVDSDAVDLLPPALWRAGSMGEVYRRTDAVNKDSAWRYLVGGATAEQKVRHLNRDRLDLRRANLQVVDDCGGARACEVGSVISKLSGYDEALRALSFDAPLHIRNARATHGWVIARACGSPMTPEIVSKLLHWYTDPYLSNELPDEYPHKELPMGVDLETVQEFFTNEFGVRGYSDLQVRRILQGRSLRIDGHNEQYWKAERLLPNRVTAGFNTWQKKVAARGGATMWPEDYREKLRDEAERREEYERIRESLAPAQRV
jgi:hypothetical protein